MTRGIVLLALGDAVYGKFAYNLALCLKRYSPEIPIHLVMEATAISKLSNEHLGLFDSIAPIKVEDCFIDNQFSPAKAKLSIYKYSPYPQTIFLDVDTVVYRDISPLFDQLSGSRFFIQNQGFYQCEGERLMPNMLWGYRDTVWQHFDLYTDALLPATNSSFFYFDKSEKSTVVFEYALNELENNPYPIELNVTTPYTWGKGANQPDELYFNVALAKLDYHTDSPLGYGLPLYFRPRPQTGTEVGIEEQTTLGYYGLGCYGRDNNNHHSIYRQYDAVVRAASYDLLRQNQEFKIFKLMGGKLANKNG